MLSWLVYFVNWLVYKPNFQILFRKILAKSRARPKMSLQKTLFTYFKRKYTTRRARHQFSHHFSQKTRRHHEPTHLHDGLHSFRVDGRSIIIGDFCRSSPDKVSTIQWYDDDFANVCNVLVCYASIFARCPLHHDGTNVSVLKYIFVRLVFRLFRINAH